jgi:DNA-binding PadR family transcriptional regulator
MGDESLDSKGQLELLILSVLAQETSAHGYRLITLSRERSDGAFGLPEGSVYPALRRLERVAFVTSRWETHNGRKRRLYELSPKGQEILADQLAAWERYSASINTVLGWSP